MVRVRSGGGLRAILYSFKKGREAGGVWKFYQALRSKNSCKTCALGMGGQRGGMVNEKGSFPEVCKKSMQAMAADMQPGILPTFWSAHSIDELRTYSPRQLETAGRLVQPVLYERGNTHYRPITWQEANDRIVTQLKRHVADETFWYFSGRSSNEAGFLLQLLARVFGTNNVNNCSFYCHQASGVGLQSSIGSGTATVILDDFEHADLVFLIGGNPASNHPRMMTTLMHLRRRGGKVIVINPVRETGLVKFRVPSDVLSLLFGTKIASQYVQPHIGGDLALLWGVAKRVDEMGAIDQTFLQRHCNGSEAWLAALRQMNWSEIYANSGVQESEIDEMARTYAAAERVVFAWTMGITHHVHGVNNVQAIANLACCRGKLGKPGSGLMPIRGHSNVQGIGSVGVTPQLKEAIFQQLQTKFGVQLPTTPGRDTLACMEAANEGKLKTAFCLGGNLYGSNPDATFAAQAMSRLEMSVFLNTTLNTGHAHGLAEQTIILPVMARDEEPMPTTQESMFSYVRLSDGGPARLPGPRSEVQVIADLGAKLLTNATGIDWSAMRDTSTIRHWIAEVVPGYGKISQIDQTKEEFQIDGRTFHTPKFPTDDGRVKLHVHSLPELQGKGDQELRLMTVRSEGQFNTVVYEEEDLYRNQERRDLILMHPDDLARFGVKNNQPVVISNATGEIRGFLARAFEEIRAGNALMYYPEANILVPRRSDPASHTPAFKGVVVKVEPLDKCRTREECLGRHP